MRRTTWAAVLFLAMAASGLAESSSPTMVGIPTARFNFVSTAQLQTEWCWAASVQMVLNWYNIPVTQTDVVNRIYHKTVDAAASENQIAEALSGFAYDRDGHKVHIHADRKTGIPSPELLVNQLSQQRPMLVTFHSTRKMLHAVVITSAEYTTNEQGGVHVTSLTYRDPNPTFQDRKVAGTVHLTGEELRKFVEKLSSYYMFTVKE